MIKFVITGTGRCGTLYSAKMLTSLGAPCVHEGIFTYNGIHEALRIIKSGEYKPSIISTRDEDWYDFDKHPHPIGESSYMSAPFLSHPLMDNVKIIHLTRNPVKVVFSFIRFGYFEDRVSDRLSRWDEFMKRHLPEIKLGRSPIERACIFYVGWNNMIESQTEKMKNRCIRHRIEDGDDALLKFLNVSINSCKFSDKRCSTNSDGIVRTIKDIPNGEVKDAFLDMCDKYGYLKKRKLF